MKDLNSANWETEVLRSSPPVVVEFWAPWCPWCKKLMPEFEAVSGEYPNLKFAKLNADEAPDIAQKYGVMGLPTVKLFCEGRSVGELVGYMPRPRLKQEIDRLVQAHRDCLQSSSALRQ